MTVEEVLSSPIITLTCHLTSEILMLIAMLVNANTVAHQTIIFI
jgi:hypothetical protein